MNVRTPVPPVRGDPPDATENQSAVSPLPTVTFIEGTGLPAQNDLSPPLTGAAITGHAQLGYVTTRLAWQVFPSTTVRVVF